MGPILPRFQEQHLTLGSGFDYVEIGFETADAEQAIVVGGLLVRRNSEPFVIWVKRHETTPSVTAFFDDNNSDQVMLTKQMSAYLFRGYASSPIA
jgi:hypothetical protein